MFQGSSVWKQNRDSDNSLALPKMNWTGSSNVLTLGVCEPEGTILATVIARKNQTGHGAPNPSLDAIIK